MNRLTFGVLVFGFYVLFMIVLFRYGQNEKIETLTCETKEPSCIDWQNTGKCD